MQLEWIEVRMVTHVNNIRTIAEHLQAIGDNSA